MVKQNSLLFVFLKSKASTWTKTFSFMYFWYGFMIMLDVPEQPFLVLFNPLFLLQSQEVYRDDAEGKSKLRSEWDYTTIALHNRLYVNLELYWYLAGRIPSFQICSLVLGLLFPQSSCAFNSLHLMIKTENLFYMSFCEQNF